MQGAVQTQNNISIRTTDPAGMRFLGAITNTAKLETESFTITEYGFIATRADVLESIGGQLNFDFPKYAYGAAFNAATSVDRVYDLRESDVIFSGVLTGIPEAHYQTDMCARPYMKLAIGENTFTVYGEMITSSLYSSAKTILASSESLTEEIRQYLQSIVDSVDKSPDTDIDIGDLYN